MANFSANKNTGDTLTAAEWNQTGSLNNFIQSTGQTLSTADLNQSAKAAAQYGSGNYFTDSGVANAYLLSPIGSMQSAAAYFDGMEIRFRAANASSGASTINVNSLGAKAIKQANGVTDITTEISTTADSILRFDNANDCFIYDTGISAATTTAAGLSLLSSPITLQNNATDPNNDIDFGAGVMQFDDGTGRAAVTATTKQLDTNFVAGTNQGGLDTGTKAVDTWYYCYAIYNPTTGATDALFTATYGAPTMPAGFTKKAYVGALLTGAAGNILVGSYQYKRDGSYRFLFSEQITDYTTSVPSISTAIAITAPINSDAILNVTYLDNDSVSGDIILNEEGQTDISPNYATATVIASINYYGKNANFIMNVGINQRIFARSNDSISTFFTILSRGFIDNNY